MSGETGGLEPFNAFTIPGIKGNLYREEEMERALGLLADAAARLAAVEAVADRWGSVLTECKDVDPRWILDRSVTTLETALDELRAALRPVPDDPA